MVSFSDLLLFELQMYEIKMENAINFPILFTEEVIKNDLTIWWHIRYKKELETNCCMSPHDRVSSPLFNYQL